MRKFIDSELLYKRKTWINLGRRQIRGRRQECLLSRSGEIEEATRRRHGQHQESSGSHYDALNFVPIFPTRSRWHKELILQTYGEENSRGRADDGSANQSLLGDGEDGLRRCSGFKGVRRSILVLPSSSLSGHLLQKAVENSNLVAS
jgi:hypothetical protein